MQVNEIITGKAKLEDYAEPHRSELRKILDLKKDNNSSQLRTTNIKIL
jgi:hypothetical protein